jgi:hypothetical protein
MDLKNPSMWDYIKQNGWIKVAPTYSELVKKIAQNKIDLQKKRVY